MAAAAFNWLTEECKLSAAKLIDFFVQHSAPIYFEDHATVDYSGLAPCLPAKSTSSDAGIERCGRADRIIGTEDSDIAGCLKAKQVPLGLRVGSK